nr:hypothetical protein Iba_chr13fCG9120 [Ipomoea batatas]
MRIAKESSGPIVEKKYGLQVCFGGFGVKIADVDSGPQPKCWQHRHLCFSAGYVAKEFLAQREKTFASWRTI